jgi:hypothetical protein
MLLPWCPRVRPLAGMDVQNTGDISLYRRLVIIKLVVVRDQRINKGETITDESRRPLTGISLFGTAHALPRLQFAFLSWVNQGA